MTQSVCPCFPVMQKGEMGMVQKITVLDNLNLMDRFLFDETMEYQDAYQATLSILLENEA